MLSYGKFLPVLMLIFAPSAKAIDCDVGVYPGLRSTGTLLQTSCGGKWRIILAKVLTYDDDAIYGFTNNRYHFMLGAGYRFIFKKHRLDFGIVYIDEETRLFLQDQTAVWFKWSYPIFPSVHCGWAHQSVPFVEDAGRNQVGCDYSFTFH